MRTVSSRCATGVRPMRSKAMPSTCAVAAPTILLLFRIIVATVPLPPPRSPSTPTIQPFESHSVASARTHLNSTSTSCLTRFHKHPEEYSDCLDHVCFLFLQESPFINLGPEMTDDRHTEVFPCSAPRSKYRFLSGTAFSIMQKTAARKALCVWGGKNCLFNPAIDFIAEQSRRNRQYKFAFTGILLENSNRLRATLSQSISIVNEQLAIFGPRVRTPDPFPLWRLVRPFHWSAWVLWATMAGIYILLVLCTYCVFENRQLAIDSFLDFIMGTYTPGRTDAPSKAYQSTDTMPGEEEGVRLGEIMPRSGSKFKFARHLLHMARGVTFLVFLAFYEIAVVNFIFIQMTAPVVQDLSDLSEEELPHYSVEKNAATEDLFIRKVFKNETWARRKYGEKWPWARCDYLELCFDRALNKTDNVKYVVTFKTTGEYNLLKRDACSKMTMYSTKKETDSFGAGWVYGSSVPSNFTRQVDRDIFEALAKGEIQDLIERDVGSMDSPECAPWIKSIDERIIGISILIIVVPFLLLILIPVLRYGHLVRQGYMRELTRRYRKDHMENVHTPQRAFLWSDQQQETMQPRARERTVTLQTIASLAVHGTQTEQEKKDLARSIATIHRILFKKKK